MCLQQWHGDPRGWRDYQQEVRLYKTSENLEVNWSVAARLVGGLRGAARRVGLAMTDQVLLPTARNIPENGERKADRNRRGIEALMTRLEAELGQQRPQKKGESLGMFFARTSSRGNVESASRTSSPGSRRVSRLFRTPGSRRVSRLFRTMR